MLNKIWHHTSLSILLNRLKMIKYRKVSAKVARPKHELCIMNNKYDRKNHEIEFIPFFKDTVYNAYPNTVGNGAASKSNELSQEFESDLQHCSIVPVLNSCTLPSSTAGIYILYTDTRGTETTISMVLYRIK